MASLTELRVGDPLRDVTEPAPGALSRYKAKVASVSPVHRRFDFESDPRCFLGVSLQNSNFDGGKLRGILEWISRRFAECTVLVGDSIHRITLESAGPVDAGEAYRTALGLGRDFVEIQAPLFEEFAGTTRFEFVTCDGIQKTENYHRHHRQLKAYFDRDVEFRLSVEAFGRDYHIKKNELLSPEELERKVRRSSEYFLEEFAVFACLEERGLRTMIYPGSFSTLSEIAAGEHAEAPEALKTLTVVSLYLKGRGR